MKAQTYYDIFNTSVGKFAAAVDESGALVAAGFGGKEALGKLADEATHNPKAVAIARRELEEYFAGKRQKFTIDINPAGTRFQQSVWAALRRIPFGKTRSYGEIAKEVGRPSAARAVGQAVGSNHVCPVIPCHRVIAGDGSLGGFAFGLKVKMKLLKLEGFDPDQPRI